MRHAPSSKPFLHLLSVMKEDDIEGRSAICTPKVKVKLKKKIKEASARVVHYKNTIGANFYLSRFAIGTSVCNKLAKEIFQVNLLVV